MGVYSFLAVGVGAAVGAWLRWGLGIYLNAAYPALPMGTLASNLIGGYLVGLAVAFFSQHPGLSPDLRLFLITGFLGGLTTFSTFSAEAVNLLSRAEYGWALAHVSAHLAGSLFLTFLGMVTMNALLKS